MLADKKQGDVRGEQTQGGNRLTETCTFDRGATDADAPYPTDARASQEAQGPAHTTLQQRELDAMLQASDDPILIGVASERARQHRPVFRKRKFATK